MLLVADIFVPKTLVEDGLTRFWKLDGAALAITKKYSNSYKSFFEEFERATKALCFVFCSSEGVFNKTFLEIHTYC